MSWQNEVQTYTHLDIFSVFLVVFLTIFFLIRILGGGIKLGPLGTVATDWPIVPDPGNYDDGEFGVMKIGRGKPAPAPLCPPQIPLDQTWA
jgi:hypothetical protein